MQSRRLVIDANIPIRAVLGRRVRELIARHCDAVAFYDTVEIYLRFD